MRAEELSPVVWCVAQRLHQLYRPAQVSPTEVVARHGDQCGDQVVVDVGSAQLQTALKVSGGSRASRALGGGGEESPL
jgi:hypothetical protein